MLSVVDRVSHHDRHHADPSGCVDRCHIRPPAITDVSAGGRGKPVERRGEALAARGERGDQAFEVHAGKLPVVSAERDELRKLVERLPEEQVPVALDEVRRRLADAQRKRAWPPAFFGAGRAGRTDVAERAEELLDEGFGHSA